MQKRDTLNNPPRYHEFRLVLDPLDDATFDEAADRIGERCDDISLTRETGVTYAEVDRAAESFEVAVEAAVKDMVAAGLRVRRVAPDPLVSLADIAQRTGRTKEGVRLLTIGSRGPGGFPAPILSHRGGQRYWSWPEVAAWFRAAELADVEPDPAEGMVHAFNAALILADMPRSRALALIRAVDPRAASSRVKPGAAPTN